MKILYKNKQAVFNYEILEEFTAGIMLTGPEIKSVRAGQMNLKGAYVTLLGGEAWLTNAAISRYSYDSNPDYDPLRKRKLLLQKKEIEKLAAKLNTQGVTLIPLAIGLENRYAKVTLALARGKKKYDKRASIKDRDTKREAERAMKRFKK